MAVYVLSESYRLWTPNRIELGEDHSRHGQPYQGVPEGAKFGDLILVFGPLSKDSVALEMAGGLELAATRGASIVLALPPTLSSADLVVLQSLVPGVECYGNSLMHARTTIAAFSDYVVQYGKSQTYFTGAGDVVLASSDDSSPEPLAFSANNDQILVVPFHVADFRSSHDRLVRTLHAAVTDYLSGRISHPAPHLEDLRLPGENAVLESISDLKRQLDTSTREALDLRRWRDLVGKVSGDRFEQLVIDALNAILESTEFRAEDRVDLRAEDFWIVGPNGDHAVGEAKGIGSHVRVANVSQVEANRAATMEDDDEPLKPGLLVVNIFRNSDEIEQRLLPVAGSVVSQAHRLDVLVLRGIDLYRLVGRALSRDDTGTLFVQHLAGGGGWLEVADDGAITLHQ